MMAPKYMQARLLQTVLEEAASELPDPIVKLEIAARGVLVTSEKDEVWYACRLVSSTDGHGRPILGSDRWEISLAQRAPLGGARSLLLRLRRIIGL